MKCTSNLHQTITHSHTCGTVRGLPEVLGVAIRRFTRPPSHPDYLGANVDTPACRSALLVSVVHSKKLYEMQSIFALTCGPISALVLCKCFAVFMTFIKSPKRHCPLSCRKCISWYLQKDIVIPITRAKQPKQRAHPPSCRG